MQDLSRRNKITPRQPTGKGFSKTKTNYEMQDMFVDPSRQFSVKDFYRGKNILITGCTGFLGKIILEKILYSVPDCGQIYVMARQKRKMDPVDRVREILSSECFTRLIKHYGGRINFERYALPKIVPISGDLIQENLGIPQDQRRLIADNVEVIINSAASVNFDDPIQEALNINYFGSVRILQLAKECKRLQVLTHISTAYVNCNLEFGLVDEEIYQNGTDVEQLVEQVTKMSIEEAKANEKKILGAFPNTYTFTKNLAEKYLLKNHGDLPTVIWRPSIIACSMADPFPGWIDTATAAGGILLVGGLGAYNYFEGDGMNCLDLIPADIVSNGCLVATAHGGLERKHRFHVYNCSSSVANPTTVRYFGDTTQVHFRYIHYNRRLFKKNKRVYWIKNPKVFEVLTFLDTDLPLSALKAISKAPIVGTPQMRKKADKLSNLATKGKYIMSVLGFFKNGDWRFENKKINKLLCQLSPEEQAEFNSDVRTVDWPVYNNYFAKGLAIWFMKEDQVAPEHNMKQIILKNQAIRTQWQETFEPKKNYAYKDLKQYFPGILSKQRFMKHQGLRKSPGKNIALNAFKYNEKEIKKELEFMRAVLSRRSSQFSFYTIGKLARQGVDGVHLENSGIEKVKQMSANRRTRVILMPMFKSYSDPLLLHQLMFLEDLESGFMFMGYEDTPKISFIEKMLKKNGLVFMKRQPGNPALDYINESLLQDVIESNPITTIFQNDIRPRCGKLSVPASSEYMVKMLLKLFNNLRRTKYDVKIVPVHINHDRAFDIKQICQETLQGDFQPELTMRQLYKILFNLREGKLGKMFVKYGDPIDIDKFLGLQAVRSGGSSHDAPMILTRELYIRHQNESPITMNSLIATTFLYYPQPKVTFQTMQRICHNLFDYITSRQYKCYVSTYPQFYDINEAALNLGFSVIGQPMNKNKGGQAQVDLSAKSNVVTQLSLAYYADQLLVYFSNEAFLAMALQALLDFDSPPKDGGHWEVDVMDVIKTVQGIKEIFKTEFIPQMDHDFTLDEVTVIMDYANYNGIGKLENGTMTIFNSGRGLRKMKFLRDMMQSYVDAYFIVIFFMNSLQETGVVVEQSKLVGELHLVIKSLFEKGMIRFPNSCHKETLLTSVERFASLGVCKQQIFQSSTGDKVAYISCPKDLKVDTYFKVLARMSSAKQSNMNSMALEIDQTIRNTMGTWARM